MPADDDDQPEVLDPSDRDGEDGVLARIPRGRARDPVARMAGRILRGDVSVLEACESIESTRQVIAATRRFGPVARWAAQERTALGAYLGLQQVRLVQQMADGDLSPTLGLQMCRAYQWLAERLAPSWFGDPRAQAADEGAGAESYEAEALSAVDDETIV